MREPAASCVRGLRAVDRGPPDLARFRAQHAAYVDALRRAGVHVTVLPPDEAWPDSVFVEDPALCLPEGAILLRPGADARAGEPAALEPALRARFQRFVRLEVGSVEGGDVLVTDREVLIGLSDRTSRAGAEALASILRAWGRVVRVVETPAGVLHFKSDCAALGGDRILATAGLAATGVFGGYDVEVACEDEPGAANCIRVNETLLVPAGRPRTAARLARGGHRIEILDIGEAEKLDAGLSCMSLRFRGAPTAGRLPHAPVP